MKTTSSRIVGKYTEKGLQPRNGTKFMLMDFPFKRPIFHYVQLECGCSIFVTKTFYRSCRNGQFVTHEHWETKDYVIMTGLLAIVIGVIAVLFNYHTGLLW